MIGSFLQERKEEKLSGIFSQHIYVRNARILASSLPYERSEDRKSHRNGSRTRKLKTTGESWN